MRNSDLKSLGGRPTLFLGEVADSRLNLRIAKKDRELLNKYSSRCGLTPTMMIRKMINDLESEDLKSKFKYKDKDFERIQFIAQSNNVPIDVMIRNLSVLGSYIASALTKTGVFAFDDYVTNAFYKFIAFFKNDDIKIDIDKIIYAK